MVRNLIAIPLIFLISSSVFAAVPDCTGSERYPAKIAFTFLKNSGEVTNAEINFSKTAVTRLASERLSTDLFRQVHYITFFKKSGDSVSVITVNDVSSEECSMSQAKIYEVKARLDKETDKK